MTKFKEWIAIISMMMNFQLILSGEVEQNTMLERMDSVEAVLELHGLKMEHIQTEMKGLKDKVDRLEISDRDILGDLSKLDRKVAELGISVSSLTPVMKDPASSDMNKAKIRGMPSNCKDLQLLGHKLSGFYTVKASQPKIQGSKIETVYCDFSVSSSIAGYLNGKSQIVETRIGVVDVKSSSVQFNVETAGYLVGLQLEQKIVFTKLSLNVGNGFDWTNQLFRAPYTGTYFFAVSGTKYLGTPDTFRACLSVRINGESIGQAVSSDKTDFGGFSFQAVRKLINATDRVDLFMHFGKAYSVYFSGWLLDEDLII